MSPQKQQPQTGPFASIQQWSNFVTVLCMLAALTLMVFMRRRVGFRRLTLGALFGLTTALYVINGVMTFHVAIPLAGTIGARHPNNSLEYFGFAFLIVGLWTRHRQWKLLLHGERWHTLSLGVSYFEFLPIRQDLIYRMVDPAVAFLAGLCLRKIGFTGLSLWVMFAAMCWRLAEESAHQRQLERELDVNDSIVEAHVQAEAVAHFEGQAEAKARSLNETGGIPTGADANLQAQIERRRKEARS